MVTTTTAITTVTLPTLTYYSQMLRLHCDCELWIVM